MKIHISGNGVYWVNLNDSFKKYLSLNKDGSGLLGEFLS